ncbi:MAG: MBOAT family protein [Myxococcota bacterium]|nr:MBOAT family protein [Myxococcota bacterium]
MLFNSVQFALFLIFVLLFYYGLPRKFQGATLLTASLIFYTLWTPAYLILLLAEIGINYALLRAMVRSKRPGLYLVAATLFTLGLLGYFKYTAMLLETLLPSLAANFGWGFQIPEILLPLGISFYSFQLLGLSIDAYRGQLDEVPSLSRYALFVCFFPQLIAGPILRGSEFLPQLERGGEPTWDRSRRGLWLIATGIGKKVILADFLLAPFVDQVFLESAPASSNFHWVALYSFAFQIYFDFSGYTDMARGIALLLGFELPMNFLEPYLSRNPSEFWRRWHKTLSRWLADYVYIPLGGNRRGRSRTYSNLALTMLLGGLWHGANWTFVIWGGLHGLLLILHRLVRPRGITRAEPLAWRDAPKVFFFFNLVCLLWVFFRAPDLEFALRYFERLFTFSNPLAWPHIQIAVVGLCIGLHLAERSLRVHAPAIRNRLGQYWWGGMAEGAVLGALIGLALMVGGVGGDFIYFQF